MLSTVLKFLEEKHTCPHCNQELTLCNAPPVHVGDGLGWGSEFLFICLNNDCSLFVNGWDYIDTQYGHVGSYRHMRIPNSEENYNMMVASRDAFTGSLVDVEAIKNQNERYRKQQESIAALDTSVAENNLEPVLYLILDEHAKIDDRIRAAELLEPLNDVACIEPIRNHEFNDTSLEQSVNMNINKILNNHFLKECPYCMELVKNRAKLCKHCQKEI